MMLRSLQRQLSQPRQVNSPSRVFFSSSIIERNEGSTWEPKKRVSRPTMDKMRALNASQPEVYNIVTLSKEFKLSVEGVRRILKSKYVPSNKEDAERQERNRYEAMGERRKEFKTKHPQEYQKTDAWKREENKVQDISTKKKSTWTNDTYGSWKTVSDKAWGRPQSDNRLGGEDRRSFSREGRSINRSEDGDRRSFNNRSGDRVNRFEGGDRRSFGRSEDREDRRSFGRSEDREDRRSFNRSEGGDRRSFSRSGDGGSFNRSVDRGSFNRSEDRGDRRSFNRYGGEREGRSFTEFRSGDRRSPRRFDGEDRGSYNNNGRNNRPFHRFREEGRSFNDREDRSYGRERREERPSHNSDDH